ncbi:MAG: hypothetical protein ACKVHP_25395, partial [Verrucomicrobiales bacterium]
MIKSGNSKRERADWRATCFCSLTLAATLLCPSEARAAAPLHKASQTFLENYCFDCHDADTQKGEINLEFSKFNWSDKGTLFL